MRKLLKNTQKTLIRNRVNIDRKQVPEIQNSIKIIRQLTLDKILNPVSVKKFKHLAKLRSLHYPLQYLCKFWPFRGLQLKMKKPILIPRYQTQYMVELAIAKIKQMYGFDNQKIKKLKFVQYGCGSGAIGLSLAQQLQLHGKMIDIDKRAVQLTKINSRLNNVQQNIEVIQGNMVNLLELMNQAQIIISNPPYLSQKQYKNLSLQVKKHESKLALVANDNGLLYVKMLVKKFVQINQSVCQAQTKNKILIVEYYGNTFEGQDAWIQQYVIKDQYGRRRFILINS